MIHRTVDELLENELIPFYTGIEAGADFVMVGHISDPEAVGDDRPAVFSKTLVTEVLRDTLKFDGIIITDAMNMGAITESCSSGDAAVKALEAGVDMILMPEDFKAACQGVEEAVEAGTIGEDRIEEFEEYVDVVQIGARNMQNFELLKELGQTRKPILLKRGFANTMEEFLMSAEYIMAGGNENVILCERGIRTYEKYTRNTLDISAVPVLKRMSHLPVVVDPSHAGGIYWMVEPLAKAAVAAGADV